MHNSIDEKDRITTDLPKIALRAPVRKSITASQRLKYEIDAYFRCHPEERMLKWRKLWRASSPARAKSVTSSLRQTVLQDKDKYLIAQQGQYLYFTVKPPAHEETEEQRLAYQVYLATRGSRGWKTYHENKKKAEENAKALGARLDSSNESDPGPAFFEGEGWVENHNDRDAHDRSGRNSELG